MLDRRAFCIAAAATGLLPTTLSARLAGNNLLKKFSSALQDDPRLLGWKTPHSDQLDCNRLTLDGKLPEDLQGIFRRNGPASHSRHGVRYGHWFDGDGMVQEFRFDGTGVSHRGRLIRTPKLRREDAAGQRLYPGFGTHFDGAPVRRPDDMNAANISVLDHHGKLLALWEGGSASVLDRETLDWTGYQNWHDDLVGAPFCAHPKVASDGSIWAFGCSVLPRPMVVLYHIGANGRLIKSAAIPLDPVGMVHDFVLTERHLVIAIPPLVYMEGDNFLDAHHWHPELGTRLLVVSRDDFEDRRWEQLPSGFGFHHGNGWEETDGTIHFDHCLAPDAHLVTHVFREVMHGRFTETVAPSYQRFTVHPNGVATISDTGETAEFPQVARVGERNRYVYTLGGETGWVLRKLVKRDLRRGTEESFDFGEGSMAEEHVFVPFPEGRREDDGWLVGTFLDYRRGTSGISVFDARRVADGPLVRARLPYPLPLGFHGQFSVA